MSKISSIFIIRFKYPNFFWPKSPSSVAQQIMRRPHDLKAPGSNPGKSRNFNEKLLFFKNGSVKDFRNSSFQLSYRPTFRPWRVPLSSRKFNFFTNKKRGVNYHAFYFFFHNPFYIVLYDLKLRQLFGFFHYLNIKILTQQLLLH